MMTKKFCTKPDIVEAIQFEYSSEGNTALREFVGENVAVTTNKNRVITTTLRMLSMDAFGVLREI